MRRIGTGSRARFLARLAGLLQRGVSLNDALAAFAQDPDPGWAAAAAKALPLAREGSPLWTVLVEAGLITESDGAVLAASEGDGARPLQLVASELEARARLVEAVRDAVSRPLGKFVIVGFLGLALVLIQMYSGRGVFPVSVGSGLLLQRPWVNAGLGLVSMSLGCVAILFGMRALFWLPATQRMLEAALRESYGLERLLLLENGARFLRSLGTALEAGLSLPKAFRRTREAFAGRVVADEIEVLQNMAEEGSSLSACLAIVPFLDATTLWTLEHALHRPDLPAELLAHADTLQAELQRELAIRTPLLNGTANMIFALPVLVGAGMFMSNMSGWAGAWLF